MITFSKIWTLISDSKTIRELIRFRYGDYLIEEGWIESLTKQEPVNKEGFPIPWMTLPFIDFISDRLNKKQSLFEFGSGNSTLYFANKVSVVRAVEHDPEWYEKMRLRLPKNCTLLYLDQINSNEYEKCCRNTKEKYDIIVVDGIRRVECIFQSINCVTTKGVFILDDSERVEYFDGIQFLIDKGWKRIDFWGLAPGLHNKKCTSIFYRSKNCLGL